MNLRQNTECEADTLTLLWRKCRAGDEGCRNALVERFLPLAKAVARRMHAKLLGQVDIEDLTSAGVFGLMDAVRAYDPRRGVRFETFGVSRIRGAMLDDLRAMDWLPRLARARQRQLANLVQSFTSTLGRTPTEGEVAREMHVRPCQARRLMRECNVTMTVSLEQNVLSPHDSLCKLAETLTSDREDNPYLQACRQDMKEYVQRNCTKEEQLIVMLYYYEGMTMKEIGQTMDISESRVSQIHGVLMGRLRERLRSAAKDLQES